MATRKTNEHPTGIVCGCHGPDGVVYVLCREGQVFEASGPMTREQAVHIAIGILEALATADEREFAGEMIG